MNPRRSLFIKTDSLWLNGPKFKPEFSGDLLIRASHILCTSAPWEETQTKLLTFYTISCLFMIRPLQGSSFFLHHPTGPALTNPNYTIWKLHFHLYWSIKALWFGSRIYIKQPRKGNMGGKFLYKRQLRLCLGGEHFHFHQGLCFLGLQTVHLIKVSYSFNILFGKLCRHHVLDRYQFCFHYFYV